MCDNTLNLIVRDFDDAKAVLLFPNWVCRLLQGTPMATQVGNHFGALPVSDTARNMHQALRDVATVLRASQDPVQGGDVIDMWQDLRRLELKESYPLAPVVARGVDRQRDDNKFKVRSTYGAVT